MTDRQKKNLKSYCSEPLDKIEHYEEALSEGFAGWCIHHRLEIQQDDTRISKQELIDNGLYFHRPASELVFMRCGEHMTLHNKGENHPLFGKHFSNEHRKKLSQSLKGKNNWIKDSHWWNNGISSKLSRECPGPEWKRGRI